MAIQRLRIRFSRGEEIKFISHLDLMRLWQRAMNRAGISLAYSEGFNPHPRMSLAAPLALGVTGEAELMDLTLSQWLSPHSFITVMEQQLPHGVKICQAQQVPLTLPSLQSQVCAAEYQVEIETEKERKEIESAVAQLLSLESLPWEHMRDTGPHRYDLRVLVNDLWLIDGRAGFCTLGMNLRCGDGGSGRPEQVCAALGFVNYPRSVHRTRLILKAS